MRFDELRARFQTGLPHPLPGLSRQRWMASRPRSLWPEGFNTEHLRHAAGLLLVVPHDTGARIVLTERAHTLDRHSGQISLPGGVIEADETVEAAALREAHEEIGLIPGDVRIVGPLTPVDIPVSGFRLHPIVATTDTAPEYHPAINEVARVIEVDIDELMRPDRLVWGTLERDGHQVRYRAFAVEGVEIWGATAMVLGELLALLGWPGPPEEPDAT